MPMNCFETYYYTTFGKRSFTWLLARRYLHPNIYLETALALNGNNVCRKACNSDTIGWFLWFVSLELQSQKPANKDV